MARKPRTLALLGAITALALAPAAHAQTEISGGFTGSVQKPNQVACPNGGLICLEGTLNPYGDAFFEYTPFSLTPIESDSKSEACGVVLGTLTATTDAGTLVMNTEGVACFPGQSTFTKGSSLHSFGNPVTDNETWTVDPEASTGEFAGATGSGTFSLRGAGARFVFTISGTLD
jgi:hypothetical protein